VPLLLLGAILAFVGGIDLVRGNVLGGIGQAGFGLALIAYIEAGHRGIISLARAVGVVAGLFWVLWMYTILFT
jgi:hypothetical protein